MATLVPAGVTFRDQMNERFPNRDRASDGWIGDTAHAGRTSDHNPDTRGWVHALDIDHDFGAPGDDEKLLAQLLDYVRAGKDHGVVSYIVHNDRLAQATTGWRWIPRPLDHHAHIHISFRAAAEHHGERFDLPIFATRPMWDGAVPANAGVYAAERDPTVHNVAAYRVACRLFDLGLWEGSPPEAGAQGYPVKAVAAWQAFHGWDVQPPGKWGPRAGGLLFG